MLNRVMLIGRLGKDVETKLTSTGKMVANFTLATNDNGKDTSWHSVQVWEKTADLCSKYLHKGSKVYIEGSIKYDTVEKDGKKSFFTKIIANHVTFLDEKSKETPQVSAEVSFPESSDCPF